MSRLLSYLCMLLLLASFTVLAEVRFPVSVSSLPKTAAQTWGNKSPKVEIKAGTQISTFNGDRKLGYSSIETNEGRCDSNSCIADGSLRLPETPDFSTPSDAIAISINGNITLPRPQDPSGSVYKVNGEAKLDGKNLTLTAPTTLYVGKLTVQSGGINEGGNPDDLVIITTGDATLQNSNVSAHIFSNKYLKIDGGSVNGTVTTDQLLLDASGVINGDEPTPPPSALTCRITGNNEDFVVEFDVIGSNNVDYKDIVFEGGNESDTLWYNQEVQSGADYIFNEQRLASGQSYTLRIEVERGQGNDISRAHYYWVQGGSKVFQESKDADIKNGTITGTGVGLETLECYNEDVESPEPDLPEQCDVFPHAAQSFTTGTNITFDGGSAVTGTIDAGGRVGFETVNKAFDTQTACDNQECIADTGLIVGEPDVMDFSPGDTDLSPGSGTHNIDAGRYDTVTLSSGTYYFTGTDYQIRSLSISGGATVYFKTGTLLRVNKMTVGGGSTLFSEDESTESLTIWAEDWQGTDAEITLSTDVSKPVYANIFSRGDVNLTGSALLKGSVTAQNLNLQGSGSVERVVDNCETTPQLPEVCEYVPEYLQTNYYFNGNSAGGITVTGAANSIVFPLDDYRMAFATGQFSGATCEFPSANGLCSTDSIDATKKLDLPVDLPPFQTGTATQQCAADATCDISGNVLNNLLLRARSTLNVPAGEYWIENITIRARAQLVTEPGTVIHYKNLFIATNSNNGNAGSINPNGDPDDLLLIGHGASSNISLNSNVIITGQIYIDPTASGGFQIVGSGNTINGGISAYRVEVSGANNTFNTSTSCPIEPPPGGGKTLIITPETAQALTCDRIPVYFKVVNDSGFPISGYSASFTAVASPDNGSACWSEQQSGGSCTANSFTSSFVDGEKTLYLESTAVGNVNVSANVASDSLSDSAGPYRFVPFGFQFDPDPAKAIAGKPVSVTVKAVADTGGSCEVIENYSGTKDLDLNSTNYIEPQSGTKVVTADSTNITFSQGEGIIDFSYFDAGHVSVTVSDPEWTKEECGAQCDDHQGDWTGLSGDADLEVRPYTLALCDITASASGITNPQGTSFSGNGFMAAGYAFSSVLKPIIWNEGDPEFGTVDLSANGKDYCNYETTPNFAKQGAYAATLEVSIPDDQPHSPANGDPGVLSGNLSQVHTSGDDELYTFNDLSWNQVGSILLTSQLQDTYYEMTVNPATIPVGRFYPAHLALVEDNYVYPSGQDDQGGYTGFGYMNQGIGHDFIVEAQNGLNEPTSNYGLFAEVMMVEIDYLAIDDEADELTDRMDSVKWDDLSWSKIDWGQADVNGIASNARLAQYTTDFMMQKLSTSSVGNYSTTPDGPYNSENAEFGLVVSKIVDNVNFNTLDLDDRGVKFTQQPDFRYGRMSLQDIGGNSDQDIDIPLRTEFWDSAERSFITNSDDRRSSYLSNQRYCRQTLWSNEGTSNASLVGNGIVDEGLDDNLSATHTANSTTHRSQVRLWLRQGNTSPQVGESGVDCSNGGSYTDQPWLQYNWRNQGDEDPSTVVTFGTFRGNDRIIFQGERGLFAN